MLVSISIAVIMIQIERNLNQTDLVDGKSRPITQKLKLYTVKSDNFPNS